MPFPQAFVPYSVAITVNGVMCNSSFSENDYLNSTVADKVSKAVPFLAVIIINYDHTDRDDENEQDRNG